MTKPNAAAMALAFDVMEDTDVPKRLRDRAKALFAEHAPNVIGSKRTTANTAAISDIFTASVRAEEAAEAPVDRSKAYTSYPRLPTVAVFATRIFEQDGNTYIVRDIVDDEGRIRNQVGITKEGGCTITWVNQRDGSPMTMPVVPQVLASPCKCGAVT